ncbi:ada2a-containing complex component 2 [Dermacentor variabilis]|uniref:ada2a-containing complex component 2 n=1 Tax=Dermacentor variabilis TaxID=34621 RepID=UPI003F5B6FEC
MDSLHCYCNTADVDRTMMLQCTGCKLYFHSGCLKSSHRSTLVGDLFFKLTCDRCTPDNVEVLERLKMQWIQVIMLTLYNLHVTGASGKLGYFRWREHICNFIDRHWTIFFGESRKRTATFRGTVAGVLSSGCPLLFRSGSAELGESGWWTLTSMKPPSPADFEGPNTLLAKCRKAKMNPAAAVDENPPVLDGPRRRNVANSLQAAINLKEKRSLLTKPAADSSNSSTPEKVCIKTEPVDSYDDTTGSSFDMHDSLMTPEDFHWSSDHDLFGSDLFRQDLLHVPEPASDPVDIVSTPSDGLLPVKVEVEDDEMLDLEDFNVQEAATMDASYFGVRSPKVEEIVGILQTDGEVAATEEVVAGNIDDDDGSVASIKEEPVSDSESCSTETSHSRASGTARKHRMDERGRQATIKEEASPKKPKCIPMSIYEEHQLLSQIEKYALKVPLPPEAQRLRRKLLVRQIKRARNLPVFDLDALVGQLSHRPDKDLQQEVHQPRRNTKDVLDRFQVTIGTARMVGVPNHVSFVTRILGLEEEQLECIASPYTQRTLKPFIFRDFEARPLRLKLLEEILSHKLNARFREESVTQSAERHPIDFCYVRPQHIPVVNAMCRTFFWPGIDLSESLQYPDFSCVAMYRKLVVGFAFMVPDVKFNEAYIPFIFTHPEWRKSGIAKFMLYHLIQTCMGKDVTLHVSATNPAILLYQKFGFKVEELILDFYDKYFPADSKECKHAMFLRLSR